MDAVGAHKIWKLCISIHKIRSITYYHQQNGRQDWQEDFGGNSEKNQQSVDPW